MKEDKERTYAFDFDGVIAEYQGFIGPRIAGKPREEIVKVIRALKKEGKIVIAHSTRDSGFLKEYCEKYDIPIDYYNESPLMEGENKGKPIAKVYIDDRALCYKGQSAEVLLEELKQFKVYRDKKNI